ncbi:AAA family ATPase [Campylobacter ureolyticus]|uniref:AAA family ATPase n=1 Tax=Campylobacter ureolyticus TaxID=827 RepID=UPI0022B3BE1F|nr:ATP-binding protein [Campylobacter ureolyticus]MCZ6110872.1 ATP-binding protein [Campylobacter ureolyticus]MDK8323791.1 ATP-binding protein [Campylobacter ureolyticus]
MLINFYAKNFLSFKDKIEFSMLADSNDKDNSVSFRKNKILKTAAIYGANASGKSNLLRSIAFFKNIVQNANKIIQSVDKLSYWPYALDTNTKTKPSEFEMIFVIDDIKYRYGFSNDENKFYEEYLYADENGREAKLFHRKELQEDYVNPTKFKEGLPFFDNDNKKIKLLNNRLFLWKCDEENGEISRKILRYMSNINLIDASHSDRYMGITKDMIKDNENLRKKIVDFIQKMDTGISDINYKEEDMPDKWLVFLDKHNITTSHGLYENHRLIGKEQFNLINESMGTQKLFQILGPVFDTLENGKILLIDELEASLHTYITATIIKLFNNEHNKNAQLIFTTHDLNTLSLFNRDQIWFAQKDNFGESEIYSLLDIKGVRNNSNFAKHYKMGNYGGLPYIDFDFSKVKDEKE